MLTEHQKDLIRQETDAYWEIARQLYPDPMRFPQLFNRHCPRVRFTLQGATAGRAHLGEMHVNYNEAIAARHFVQFMDRTVPHEVAHFVAMIVFNDHGHKRGWKKVMADFGVEDVSRCHNYDVEGIARRHKRFTYHCNCVHPHKVSAAIHNKIQRGQRRRCRACQTTIVFGERFALVAADRSSQ